MVEYYDTAAIRLLLLERKRLCSA